MAIAKYGQIILSCSLILLILLPACSPETSEKTCGGTVCDDPENAQNCPKDCGAGTGEGSRDGNSSQALLPPDSDTSTDGVYAQVFFDVAVQRKDGEGTCGVFPCGVDTIFGGDNSCRGMKYCCTYVLRANAFQHLNINQQEMW